MTITKSIIAAAFIAAPVPAYAADWTGGYVGGQIGASDIDTNAALTGDGLSYGLVAGYNFTYGTIVYGGEIDYDFTDYDIGNGAVEVDSTARIKARVGTELGGGLAYGAIGLVQATSPDLGDDSGYLFGIGYDYPVAENVFVGGEILQHEFDDYNGSGIDVDVMTVKARVGFQF